MASLAATRVFMKLARCSTTGRITTDIRFYNSSSHLSRESGRHATRGFKHGQKEADFAYKAVIFDKDGTLISLDTMWVPWAKKVVSSICDNLNISLQDKILDSLGVCIKTHRINPGLLAECTNSQIAEALCELLVEHGVDRAVAEPIAQRYTKECHLDPQHVSPLHDLKQLFTDLRERDVRVGLCTSDNRANTLATLTQLDVLHMIDAMICGDDHDGMPKPDPHNAKLLCTRLEVEPAQTVMVGDTVTDIQFARNGNFGLAVGVLSGATRRESLEKAWLGTNGATAESDGRFEIIASIAELIPVLDGNRILEDK